MQSTFFGVISHACRLNAESESQEYKIAAIDFLGKFPVMPEDFTSAIWCVGYDSLDDNTNNDGDVLHGANSRNGTRDVDPNLDRELNEVQGVMADPSPDASTIELHQALGRVQISYNHLQEDLIKMRNELSEFKAKKYTYLYHLWVPSSVFPLHTYPLSFNLCSPMHYQTVESRATANSTELYLMLPSELQAQAMKYEDFEQLMSGEHRVQPTIANYSFLQFMSTVNNECGNILKPIKDSAVQLFTHLSPGLDPVVLGDWRKRMANPAFLTLLK
ncbi:hypothetical protein F5141DRAFT_1220782 [Pisolithus sp. B1]|nr:hypothetical protein F5141DRAFT_1220782 [Pisolithus sp. B1]